MEEADTWPIHPCMDCVFCFSRIRTLVAMATYTCSFHRLIMGKVEIENVFCLNGDNWKIFLRQCLLLYISNGVCPNP